MTARAASPRSPAAARPDVVVCAGAGGVGKTTTSAALAVALARQGRSTLLVTIDPARRLASAMGVVVGDQVTPIDWPGTSARLHALMPDPRRSLGIFVDTIFVDEPEARAHLLQNPIYRGLSDAAAGVHELVAMTLVANAAAGGDFDVVVIDTAPSRQAVDFVTYPQRLAALLGGRTVGWLSGMAERAEGRRPSGGMLAWGAGRIDSLLASVTGPNLVRDTASLFGDLVRARSQFVALAAQAAELLLGDRTEYLVVAAPTAAARDDAMYLHRRLTKLGRPPRAIVLNRADVEPDRSLDALRQSGSAPPSLREVVLQLDQERVVRTRAADGVAAHLASVLPGLPIVRLPFLEAIAPEEVVSLLAACIVPHLAALVSSPRL